MCKRSGKSVKTIAKSTKPQNEDLTFLCRKWKKAALCMFHKPNGNNYAIMHNVRTREPKQTMERPPLPPRHDGYGGDLCLEVIMMVKQVKVSNFTEVKGIVSAAAKCYNDVGVHDMKGSIADAKSILGMMSLDYSHPVKIVCENEHDLNSVVNALKQ